MIQYLEENFGKKAVMKITTGEEVLATVKAKDGRITLSRPHVVMMSQSPNGEVRKRLVPWLTPDVEIGLQSIAAISFDITKDMEQAYTQASTGLMTAHSVPR